MDYTSVSQIKEILELFQLAMQKKFGQNFLISQRFREQILQELNLSTVNSAWEIGPGLGSLTALIPETIKLTLFEIDYGFIRFLQQEFPHRPIVPGDFVKTFNAIGQQQGTPHLIYGNLPYCSAAAMVGGLIEKALLPPRMVFMVQKEAALRMKARPGSKDYSAFSLLCALDYEATIAFHVPADCFYPQPEVISSVVTLKRHHNNDHIDRRLYLTLSREMFKSRRKTLKNNLASLQGRFPQGALEVAFQSQGIAMNCRGEEISPQQLAKVVESLSKLSEK